MPIKNKHSLLNVHVSWEETSLKNAQTLQLCKNNASALQKKTVKTGWT